MRKVELEQGSPEWLEFRKSGIGASECAAVFGKCKYNTPLQLWEKKVYDIETEVTFPMIRGSQMEPIIREQAEQVLGEKFDPVCGIHDEHEFILASLDGINATGDVIMEIKYASKANHSLAAFGKVPDNYLYQVQQQLLVSGAKKALYVSWNSDDLQIVEVFPDSNLHEEMVAKLMEFWEMVCLQIPPASSKKDRVVTENDQVLRSKKDRVVTENDQVLRFVNIRKQNDEKIKELKSENEKVTKQLIELANGNSIEGEGFKFSQYEKPGSVQYAQIPELSSVDLEQYRKPAITCWKLTVEK